MSAGGTLQDNAPKTGNRGEQRETAIPPTQRISQVCRFPYFLGCRITDTALRYAACSIEYCPQLRNIWAALLVS